jgi:hypothetical protein
MKKDPIVEEVRRVRQRHAKKHNYDLDAIYEDIKRFEKQLGKKGVSLPPKKILRRTGS